MFSTCVGVGVELSIIFGVDALVGSISEGLIVSGVGVLILFSIFISWFFSIPILKIENPGVSAAKTAKNFSWSTISLIYFVLSFSHLMLNLYKNISDSEIFCESNHSLEI